MAGYEQTMIVGNVGKDADLRYTQSGTPVCDFSVAVTTRWRDSGTNEQREKTNWYRVTAWRGLAETCAKYVKKGMQVMVVGANEARAYTDKNGDARATLELTAQTVQFLSGGNGEQSTSGSHEAPAPTGTPDIPF